MTKLVCQSDRPSHLTSKSRRRRRATHAMQDSVGRDLIQAAGKGQVVPIARSGRHSTTAVVPGDGL